MSALSISVAVALCATSDPTAISASAQDAPTTYEAAVADRLAGRPTEAIEGLTRVLAQTPGNLDARLNLGLALLAVGRLDEAEAAFDQVVNQAPDYADARLGLVRVALAKGEPRAARILLDETEARGGADASEISALRMAAAVDAAPLWRASVSTATSRLSGDLPDWRSSMLVLGRQWTGGRSATVALEATERFGQSDLYLEGRLDQRIGDGAVYLSVGGARDAVYRPQTALWSGFSLPLAQAWTAALDVGWASYRAGSVTTLRPAISYSVGPAVLTARWIGVRDENGEQRSGYGLKGMVTASPGLRFQAAYGEAPETSDGLTVDVTSTAIGLAVDVSAMATVFIDGVHEERTAYDRDEATLAIGWRF